MVALYTAATVQVLPTNYSLLVIGSAPQLRKCPVMDNVHLHLCTRRAERSTQSSRLLLMSGSAVYGAQTHLVHALVMWHSIAFPNVDNTI